MTRLRRLGRGGHDRRVVRERRRPDQQVYTLDREAVQLVVDRTKRPRGELR